MIEKATIGLTRNDYEPDICFFTAEKAAQFTEDQMIFPTPDFVVENPLEKHRRQRPGHQTHRLCRPRRTRILDHRPQPPNIRAIHPPRRRHRIHARQQVAARPNGAKPGYRRFRNSGSSPVRRCRLRQSHDRTDQLVACSLRLAALPL